MTYQITIVGNYQPPPPTITNASVLPAGTFETYYTNVFDVSGGSIPYTCSVVAGQLPPGLILLSDITMSQTGDDLIGTPEDDRHLHLHHAGHRRRRQNGQQAVQPDHPANAAAARTTAWPSRAPVTA